MKSFLCHDSKNFMTHYCCLNLLPKPLFSHSSVHTTRKLIAQRFMWPSMNKDLVTWSWACRRCQLVKVHQHTVAPLGTFAPPTQHFQHVHIGIVGHCHSWYICWLEAVLMQDMSTASCIQAFLYGWVSALAYQCISHLTREYSSPLRYGNKPHVV